MSAVDLLANAEIFVELNSCFNKGFLFKADGCCFGPQKLNRKSRKETMKQKLKCSLLVCKNSSRESADMTVSDCLVEESTLTGDPTPQKDWNVLKENGSTIREGHTEPSELTYVIESGMTDLS